VSEAMKKIDDETKKQVRMSKLDALEEDNLFSLPVE
jgi:hypothetical protein